MNEKERVWVHVCPHFNPPMEIKLREFIWSCPSCGVLQPRKVD